MSERLKTYEVERRSILLRNGQTVILRPLALDDKEKITEFLSGLSDNARHYYVLDNYGKKTADNVCESVVKPEKLHFVAETESSGIIALVKFSLDLPEADKLRFSQYSVDLVSGTVSRCGTCIADDFQNVGLGGITLQQIIDTSSDLGLTKVMLSGGIFADNERAIHMVQKYGFKIVGEFTDKDNQKHVDMLRSI
jgi:diamine N-acetyltransferase